MARKSASRWGSTIGIENLVIDPVLTYSTYLGGTGGDAAYGVAVDSAGDAYVTGVTASTNFPVTSGVYQTTNAGDGDVFVTKFNPTGTGDLVFHLPRGHGARYALPDSS